VDHMSKSEEKRTNRHKLIKNNKTTGEVFENNRVMEGTCRRNSSELYRGGDIFSGMKSGAFEQRTHDRQKPGRELRSAERGRGGYSFKCQRSAAASCKRKGTAKLWGGRSQSR